MLKLKVKEINQKIKRYSLNDKVFFVVTGLLLTIFFILVLYPCIFVISASLSSGNAVQSGKVILFPVEFNLKGYETVLKTVTIWTGYKNSIFYTVVGTFINIIVTLLAAYPLSRKDLPGRNKFMLLFTFTMFFNGGIITNYLLIVKLGLINTRLALLLPSALGVYNMIIAKTFLQENIPTELLEASQIDGCNDTQFFFKMVLPLSKAIIAVLVLFYGVAHWNTYFNAMIYLSNRDIYPLTIFLKEILIADQIDPTSVQDPELQAQLAQTAGVIKYALIVVSMLPVLIIYPFIQKHFVKGVMIGAVKG